MTKILEQAAGPPAPAAAPSVVVAEVDQQDVVMSGEEQDAISLAASWDEESFLRTETQDPDLIQTNADFDPQPFFRRSDFLEEVKCSWQHLASVPSVSKSTVTLASMEGAEAVGFAQFPPVDSPWEACPKILYALMANAGSRKLT
ncbi:UNVERIFIED_CONTAM: hypothetical protein FKN15_048085 [Acipenser sinensis]